MTPAVEDPVLTRARREAILILVVWAVSFVYSATYCYLFGYASHAGDPGATGPAIGSLVGPLETFNRTAASVNTPFQLGIPDWVFYGVALPWAICIAFTFWFCLVVFVEDDLGTEPESDIDEPRDGQTISSDESRDR